MLLVEYRVRLDEVDEEVVVAVLPMLLPK